MDAAVWIPIALSSVMAIVAIITLAMNGKKSTEKEAEQRASLTADVKYIRGSIDEIKVENRVIQKDVGDLKIKVIEVEQGMKSAHKRLDDLQKGA
jgi:5-bromo-4-chloroindolyl phosphate hydrolysis protein